MGSAISSVTHMILTAGDLRHAARQASAPDLAVKFETAAANLETAAVAQVGRTNSTVGALLDMLA